MSETDYMQVKKKEKMTCAQQTIHFVDSGFRPSNNQQRKKKLPKYKFPLSDLWGNGIAEVEDLDATVTFRYRKKIWGCQVGDKGLCFGVSGGDEINGLREPRNADRRRQIGWDRSQGFQTVETISLKIETVEIGVEGFQTSETISLKIETT